MGRLATTVWQIRPDVVLALNERLGLPVDSYVNGSQTWFTETADGVELEWRLHPVAGYRPPQDLSHYELWDAVVDQLATGADASSLRLGGEFRSLDSVWDGLECFPAHDDEIEPATLATVAAGELGVAPDAAGLVDHDVIGDAWERSRGAVSIVDLLLDQLRV